MLHRIIYLKFSLKKRGTYLVFKGVQCSSAHFKSETFISHPAAIVNLIKNLSHQGRKVKRVLCKISASVRYWKYTFQI
jgi:hypothetical protein